MKDLTMSSNCPICGHKILFVRPMDSLQVRCLRCGCYYISGNVPEEIGQWSQEQKSNLSGWIAENQGFLLTPQNLNSLSGLRTPTPAEKANKLLLALAREFPKAGRRIAIFEQYAVRTELTTREIIYKGAGLPKIAAYAWAQDDEELVFIVVKYLQLAKHFLSGSGSGDFTITPEGWAHIESISQKNSESTTGFIAMWFDRQMDAAYVAISKAIEIAGYAPVRIDKQDHNNKIDDAIIAAIRRSRFLVADFTGQRGGVYFEAGFAMGLGVPVFWLCREDSVGDLHFDTRQYNHIVWNANDVASLCVALQRRIEATIGAGRHKHA